MFCDVVSLACRTYAKASGLQLKVAALKLAAAVVLGLNPLDRSAPGVQLEAWKLCERAAKVGGRGRMPA